MKPKYVLAVVSIAIVVAACMDKKVVPASVKSPSSLSLAADSKEVYVSLTFKGQVSTFLNRLADETHQLVVTRQPVPGALQSVKVSPKPGQNLVVVELRGQTTPVMGELARVGDFAVASVDLQKRDHVHFPVANGIDLYNELVSSTEQTVPVLSEFTSGFVTGAPSAESATIPAVDRAFLELKLKELSGAIETQVDGKTVRIKERQSDGMRALARSWLKQEYEAIGYKVTLDGYTGSFGKKGVNVVAERTGDDPSKVLVLSSHLDSVGNAGADDDGAGTIAALAVAQAIKDLRLKWSLRIVAFDQEEIGLVGSKTYVKNLKDAGELDKVIGNVNLEMLGYDSDNDGALHIIDCNENTSAELTSVFEKLINREDLGLHKVAACTNRSDHAAFWTYNKPAIVISQNYFGGDPNPCYHKPCDKVDRVSFDYMTKITNLIARGTGLILVEP